MSANELAGALATWTPHLAGGFVWNVIIAVLAMGLGTLFGAGIGRVRFAGPRFAGMAGRGATSVFRNVPSFVLLFYVAFLIPVEVRVAGVLIGVPSWVKATIALTIPATAFAADQTLAFLRQRRERRGAPETVFWTAWMQYFLIVFMASSTASVIGADEVVARANTVVATRTDTTFMLVTYAYVALWFLIAAFAISRGGPGLVRRITRRDERSQ